MKGASGVLSLGTADDVVPVFWGLDKGVGDVLLLVHTVCCR